MLDYKKINISISGSRYYNNYEYFKSIMDHEFQ